MGGSKRRFVFARAIMGAGLAAAVLFAAGPGAAAGEPDRMISKFWRVKPVVTGTGFAHCMINALYRSGVELIISHNKDDEINFFVRSLNWKFDPDLRFPATLSIDGRHFSVDASGAITTNAVSIAPSNRDRYFEALKHGQRLDVEINGAAYSFALSGVGPGLAKLARCREEGMAASGEQRRDTPSPTSQAPASTPSGMKSKSWALERFDDESTGKFSDCNITARYESSRALVFLLDRDSNFDLYLVDSGLRFDENVSYRAALSVDGRTIGDYETYAADKKGFGFSLPYTDGMIYALKHGRRVAISVAGKTYKFSLAGTLVALTDLERCVARGIQPAAAGGRQSAPAETRPTTRVEGPDPQILADRRRFFKVGADDDWAFVSRLLDSVALWDFKYLGADDPRRKSGDDDYYWENGSTWGVAFNTNLKNRTVVEFVRDKIAQIGGNLCDNAFDHDVREAKMASGAKAWRAFGICPKDSKRRVLALLIFAYQGNAIVVVNYGSAGDTDIVRDADNRLFGWFQATF